MYFSVFSLFMKRRMNERLNLKDNQIRDTKQKSLVEVKLLLRKTAIEMARSMEIKPNQSLSSIIAKIIKERYQSIITNGNYDEQSVPRNQK
jgi:hypothetical protein